jgi:hexosaminidase
MAPNSFTYFDLYQGDPELEPDAYSSLYLSKVYQFDPVPQDINNDKKHHILGGHGCLWTETVQTFGHVEYMIFPRMLALSETIWSPKVNLDWNSFINRMEHHQLDLENQGINFSKSAYQANIHVAMDSSKNQLLVQINNELNKHTIRYSTDGTDPESSSKLYDGPFLLKEKAQIKAATFRNGRRYSQISLKSFNKNKATGKKIIYTHKYNPSYTAGGNAGLVNGLSGSKDFHDGFWQGFQKHDLNVTIDLGLSETIRSISTNFYHNPGSWIYLPYQVSFLISEDGETFSEIKNFENITLDTNGIQSYSNKFKPQNARYIKIIGKNIGTRPGRPNEEAWIFIDEITVN